VRKYTPSIEILPQWGEPILTVDFNSLRDPVDVIPSSETITTAGKIERYNKNFNNISIKKGKPLDKNWRLERKFYKVTTSEDPIISKLMKTPSESGYTTVYGTDAIICSLMATLKSVYSWDIIVTKKGDEIVFDKRDDSSIDYLSVNENSFEPPQEEGDPPFNSLSALHKEATLINQNFSQQVLLNDGSGIELSQRNPFESPNDVLSSVGYLYRKFELEDNINLVVRTELDAYKSKEGKQEFILVKALNEYDLKITHSWRKLLETLRSGVFATEVHNNGNKMAKWALQSHLSGATGIKLGYITRSNPKDFYNHVILAVDYHRTDEFISETNVDLKLLWGTLKHIIDIIRNLDDGKFLILRDPNEKLIHFYRVANEEDFLKERKKY